MVYHSTYFGYKNHILAVPDNSTHNLIYALHNPQRQQDIGFNRTKSSFLFGDIIHHSPKVLDIIYDTKIQSINH
jgi:hypothetical protein